MGVLLLLGLGCSRVISPAERPLDAGRELKAGTRVRVHLAHPKGKVMGDLMRVSADTLVVAPEEDRNSVLTLSALSVRRVDISRGRRSNTGRGAFFGFLGGLVGGYVALLQACKDDCVGATILVGLPIGGALVGAGIGAGIGSLTRTERWRRVSWP